MKAEEAISKYFTLTEDLALFWHGPASQWWASTFSDGVDTYNCCEQYMMAKKAELFGDSEVKSLIMECSGKWEDQKDFNQYPRRQKSLGRKVRDFDQRVWDAVKLEIVTEGNRLRKRQDPLFAEVLSLTLNRTIVEASPVDPVWGIGLAREEPDALVRERWRGENLLGVALTTVRDEA